METNNIPKGTLQITLTNGIQYLAIGLFYIIVTKTNALTRTDIGILSILSFLSSTFLILTTLALPTALTKFTSEKLGKNQEEATSIQKTVTKIVLTSSLMGFAIAACLSEQLSQFFLGTPAYAFLIILMLTHALLFNIVTIYKSSLQALYLFGKMALVTLTFIVISRTTATTLALLNLGLEGVLIGYITGSSTALLLAIPLIRGKLPKTNHNTPLKPILQFSLPLFLSSLTLLILNWADIVIVNSLTGNYSLTGIYYIAVNSVNVLSILWIPITTTIFPALSARHGLKNPEGISDILRNASRYLSYIILPSCLGLATISPTALTFFYGQNYLPGALPLSILSTATIIVALYSLFTITLTAIGKTTQILKINVASAISAVAMLLAFVPFLEATGAAVARLATQIISLTLAIYVLRKHAKLQLDKEALWKSVVASAATIPFLIALESTISTRIPVTQTLTIEILVAASIYLLSLYTLKALKSQDFDLLRQSFPKFLSKYINILEKIMVR